jgi:hypothetical protein
LPRAVLYPGLHQQQLLEEMLVVITTVSVPTLLSINLEEQRGFLEA